MRYDLDHLGQRAPQSAKQFNGLVKYLITTYVPSIKKHPEESHTEFGFNFRRPSQGCGAVTFLVGSGSGSGSGEAFRLRLRLRLRVKLFGGSGSGSGSGQNVPAPAAPAPAPAPIIKSSYGP